MRSKFDKDLAMLNHELIEMGALCERIIVVVTKALTDGYEQAAKNALPIDDKIDEMEHVIEKRCLKLLLSQQPVARDLRQISSALKMITDMERIGDQAYDIAEIISFMKGRSGGECAYIKQMGKTVIKMVSESIDAYVKQDESIANEVIKTDDVVDDYFDKTKKDLISIISSNPADGEYAIDLLMIAKYFERIGDHATNIAEWVVFSITGFHKGVEEI